MAEIADDAEVTAFRGFFENLPVGAVQISEDGAFLQVNRQFCTLTGYARADVLGMRVGDLDHPDDREADRGRWAAFLGSPGTRYDVEKRYLRRDGSVMWVHVTAARITTGTDQLIIAKTVEDITERVTAAIALREREARLREALAAKEEFLGLVSHELRTPLTVILGLADIAARDGIGAERAHDIILDIRESATHLGSLLESMLVLARTSREDRPIVEPIVLAHLLERAVVRHREVYPRRPIELDVRTKASVVEAHEPWIEQVIANMLGNAEKYSPGGARIDVILEADESRLWVRILDEGAGIDEEDLALLFEPFYRSPRARAAVGLGLGLAVCKRLIELQGGSVWARPRSGDGAEFGFSLPRLAEEPADETASPPATRNAAIGDRRARDRRVHRRHPAATAGDRSGAGG